MSKRRPSAKTEIKRQRKFQKAAWKLKLKKPLELSLREHLGKIIDNTEVPQWLEIVAITGMTIIVKNVIEASEDLLVKTIEIGTGLTKIPLDLLYNLLPAQIKGMIGIEGLRKPLEKVPELYEKTLDTWQIEIAEWLIAFTLAFLIVHNFGEIMKATGDILTSITGLVRGMLIGGVLVA